MPKRLLHRQVSLLNYLTSGSAIFGGEREPPLDPALRGIDRALLRIEARFSHDKRVQKIVAVFPRTFELLGARRETLIRDFAATCPPDDISRLANARQFHDFLCGRWRREPPMPPYLPDVAACELACASARAATEVSGCDESVVPAGGRQIRCSPGVVRLRSAYDIRPIFERSATAAVPMKRDTLLAITLASGGDEPRVFELAAEVFDLLGALVQWTDATALNVAPAAHQLIAELAQAGLVEVRG